MRRVAGFAIVASVLLCVQAVAAWGQAKGEAENAALLGTFQQEMPGFAFSRDGRHAIIGFSQDGSKHYEVDGRAGRSYEDCTRPVFSDNGRHWAYAGKTDGKWWVVQPIPTPETIAKIKEVMAKRKRPKSMPAAMREKLLRGKSATQPTTGAARTRPARPARPGARTGPTPRPKAPAKAVPTQPGTPKAR